METDGSSPADLIRRPPVQFTLRQVECFLAVAETGSISAAAVALNASDSAVSDSLTAMERMIGAVLFNRRRSRGASLTSDGLAILPIAYRMLNDAEELAAAVGKDPTTISGPVRLGAIDTLGPVVIPRLLLETRELLPGVRIEYTTADVPTLLGLLADGQLDLLLTFDIDVPPDLRRRALYSTEPCVVVAADHPLATNKSARLEDLADEPMVLLDIASSRMLTLEVMAARSITPRIAYHTQNYELCRSLVGRGLGYTMLMRREIDSRTWDGGEVAFIPIEPPPRRVDILLTWPDRALSPRVSSVIELAAELTRQWDHWGPTG